MHQSCGCSMQRYLQVVYSFNFKRWRKNEALAGKPSLNGPAFADKGDAKDMAEWSNGGGFSVDALVRIEADDRAGLERLLRYCVRLPFSLERLEAIDAQRLAYHLPKPQPDGSTELMLSPLELIQRLAELIPPLAAIVTTTVESPHPTPRYVGAIDRTLSPASPYRIYV